MNVRKVGLYSAASVLIGAVLVATTPTLASASTAWVTQETYQPSFTSIDGISCPSTSHCVAVGDTVGEIGGIAVGSGNSWTREIDPVGVVVLNAVACPSTSVCVAAGELKGSATTMLYSTNGGTSWGTATIPSGIGGPLAISCSSTSDCVAVGGGVDPIDVTSDGGKQWTLEKAPAGVTQLSGVSCLPAKSKPVCFAVGLNPSADNGLILKSSGTTSWSSTVYTESQGALNNVACASASDCIVVGVVSYSLAAIATTTNGGAKWNPATVPTGVADLLGASCLSASACVATGYTGSTAEVITGGTSSTTFKSATLPSGENDFGAVSCIASTKDCTAVGYFTAGYVSIAGTSDSGSSWTGDTFPLTPTTLPSVSCASSADCVAVGVAPSGGVVETTTNGGSTWTGKIVAGLTSLLAVACVSTDCYAVGSAKGAAEWLVSTNHGSSWSQSGLEDSSINQYAPPSLSCKTASDCVVIGTTVSAGGPPTSYSTTDGGSEWTQTSTSLTGDTPAAISCSSTSACVSVGSTENNEGGALILVSTDFGLQWITEPVPETPDFFDSLAGVSCASTSDCVAVGVSSNGYALTTSDGGGSWFEHLVSTPTSATLHAVACTTTSDCIGVGVTSGETGVIGSIESTTNGGDSWTPVAAPTVSKLLYGVSCTSAKTCEAAGVNTTGYGGIIVSSTVPVAPLSISTSSLPGATVGKMYAATMKATGGTTPYAWKVSSGSKPPGLSFSSAGKWSGKPTKAGTYSFTLRVTDKTGTKVTKSLKIVVAK